MTTPRDTNHLPEVPEDDDRESDTPMTPEEVAECLADGGVYEVMPCPGADLMEHVSGIHCWCHPKVEDDGQYIEHRALDPRLKS